MIRGFYLEEFTEHLLVKLLTLLSEKGLISQEI